MTLTVEQAEKLLALAREATLKAMESDLNRSEGSGAQERRHEERMQRLVEAERQCQLDLEEAKRRQIADSLADRLERLHRDLEARGNLGLHWSTARALEDRIGANQAVHGDYEKATELLEKYRF